MNKQILLFILAAIVAMFCTSCGDPPEYRMSDSGGMKIGDDPSWLEKDFDHSEWGVDRNIPPDVVFWVRLSEYFEEDFRDQGVTIGIPAAYEAYWDGHYLGTNGELGIEGKTEVPGSYHFTLQIPDSLCKKGQHSMALRATKAHRKPNIHAFLIFDQYRNLIEAPLQMSKYMFMFAGAFALASIYFFIMFFANPRDFSPLIFAFICLLFCAQLLLEYLKLFHAYAYPFQHIRLHLIGISNLLLSVLVPLFFMKQLATPRKFWLLGIWILGLLLFEYKFYHDFDFLARRENIATAFFCVLICGFAVYQKVKGALVVFGAWLLAIVLGYWMLQARFSFVSGFDVSIFVGFGLVLVAMLYILIVRTRKQQRDYQLSLVHSERLKNELLRKNIRPHFIMNTLTSLIDWVEESPDQGVKLINALAGEFEILNDIADEKLIPIEQEIDLCKNHLKVMAFRKEIEYLWKQEDVIEGELIPPAVFHTIVENGITHSLPSEDGTVEFRLLCSRSSKQRTYRLLNVARTRGSNKRKKVKDGTGLKYIKSRLQESYPDKWTFSSEAIEDGWATQITIVK